MGYNAVEIREFARSVSGGIVRHIAADKCPACSTRYAPIVNTGNAVFRCVICETEVGAPNQITNELWLKRDIHMGRCMKCNNRPESCPVWSRYTNRINREGKEFRTPYVIVFEDPEIKYGPITLGVWTTREVEAITKQYPNRVLIDQTAWVTVIWP
mgnify:CR=1 FL=1